MITSAQSTGSASELQRGQATDRDSLSPTAGTSGRSKDVCQTRLLFRGQGSGVRVLQYTNYMNYSARCLHYTWRMSTELGQFSLLLSSPWHYRAQQLTPRTMATTHRVTSLLGRQNPTGFLCCLSPGWQLNFSIGI